jgi:hypothetical protein
MNLYRPKVKSILARRPSGGFDPFLNVRRETGSKGYSLKDYHRGGCCPDAESGLPQGTEK